MKISELMNKVYTIDKDISLLDVAKIFSREGISSVVFIKKGNAAGIITERDLIRNAGSLKDKFVSKVMSKKLITIEYDKDLEDAVEVMRIKKIKRLLVVDEQKTLVGIITATDVIANADLINKMFSFF